MTGLVLVFPPGAYPFNVLAAQPEYQFPSLNPLPFFYAQIIDG